MSVIVVFLRFYIIWKSRIKVERVCFGLILCFFIQFSFFTKGIVFLGHMSVFYVKIEKFYDTQVIAGDLILVKTWFHLLVCHVIKNPCWQHKKNHHKEKHHRQSLLFQQPSPLLPIFSSSIALFQTRYIVEEPPPLQQNPNFLFCFFLLSLTKLVG